MTRKFVRGAVITGVTAIAVAIPTGAITYSILGAGSSEASEDTRSPEASEPGARITDPWAGQKLPTKNFPKNSRGMTYGSNAEAGTLAESPDLVAVVGDNGVGGYAFKEELEGDMPTSPEDAANAPTIIVIDIYDQEGLKVVDTFTMALAGEPG